MSVGLKEFGDWWSNLVLRLFGLGGYPSTSYSGGEELVQEMLRNPEKFIRMLEDPRYPKPDQPKPKVQDLAPQWLQYQWGIKPDVRTL